MSQLYQDRCQIFSQSEITSLRKAGSILHDCLQYVATLVVPGITTIELDRAAEEFIRGRGGLPAFKGYHGYPATLCTSINDVCVHGMPKDEVLNDGDIIALDCGVLIDDLYTDACITVPVGTISEGAKALIKATEEALQKGIAEVHAGAHTGDISHAIHAHLKKNGFDAMRQLTGHGLGDDLHQFPEIPNIGTAGKGAELPMNTIIAIEPISTAGSTKIKEDGDGWTLRTSDHALSAHFEHTVLVTEAGYQILT